MYFSDSKLYIKEIILILLLFHGKQYKADKNIERLMHDLLTDYDPLIKPSENSTVPLDVYFELYLHNIIDVDEKNQVLATNCWFQTRWVDHYLRWNASDYGGIKSYIVPSELIWKPDIIMHNVVNTKFQSALMNAFANVSSAGEVTLYEQSIFYSSCAMDISYFPFDTQTCRFQWGSWSYDSTQIDIFQNEDDQIGVIAYEDSGEFELSNFSSAKSMAVYDGRWFVLITYTLKIRRRSLTHVINLIIPCGLINAIALLVFYMPSQTGEKVTLGISSLISMTVFLMNLIDSLPSTGILSIINIYYGVSMLLVTLATSLSILTLNIYYQGERKIPLPGYFKRLVNVLSRLVYIPTWANYGKDKHNKQEKCSTFTLSYSKILESLTLKKDLFSNETYADLLLQLIEKHNSIIEHHENNLRKKDKYDHLHQEWKHASVVLDRLFLIIFILISVITSFAILYGRSSNDDQ